MICSEEHLIRILASRLVLAGNCPLTKINEPDCPGSCIPVDSNAKTNIEQCIDCIVESARNEAIRLQSIAEKHFDEMKQITHGHNGD